MELNLMNPNNPTRYPVTEKITLYVSHLEDELRLYKATANYMGRQGGADNTGETISNLAVELEDLKKRLTVHESNAGYVDWFAQVFGKRMPVPNTSPFTTFKQGTPWGDKVAFGMQDGEILYAEHLFKQIVEEGIQGDVIEFGTYYGHWVQVICEMLERNGWQRKVWGFDSFEGLPKPDVQLNPDCWTEGMYSAPFDEVRARLQVDKRPYLQLVKGWFNETLMREPATSIDKIAYARIDSDLYESCIDCLKYLDGRLVDRAILVFDDWQFSTEIGEPRAFKEWLEAGGAQRYNFEFLEFNLWAHLYVRVRKL
jgi:Macrocin-O-methyltransferase (TylF)